MKNLQKHISANHTHLYPCENCSYTAPNRFRLKRHMKTHMEEKPTVSCPICGKSVVTLDQHLRVVHGPKKFHCDQCSYTAPTPREIERHTNALHLKTKEICTYCGKGFSRDHLQNHIKNKHHKIRDKSCGQCDKSFVTTSELRRHVDVPPQGDRSTCDHCGGSFVTVHDHVRKIHLNMKVTKGREEECQHCGETVFHLKHHIRMEHDDNVEKVYCDLCPYRTLKQSVLKKHKKQRHGEEMIRVEDNH